MVILKELLEKHDTGINIHELDEALLQTGYDEKLGADNFTYNKTIEDTRNKHTFQDNNITITLRENPVNLTLEVTHENGIKDYTEFDEKGNVLVIS